jgi:DNA-binding phage protein
LNHGQKLYTRPYDAAAYLKTEQDYALYQQAVINESDGDAALVVPALRLKLHTETMEA